MILILFIYIYIYIYIVTKWCLLSMCLILTSQIMLYFRQVPMYSLSIDVVLTLPINPYPQFRAVFRRCFGDRLSSFYSSPYHFHPTHLTAQELKYKQSGFGHKLHCWNNKTWIYRWFVSFLTHWGRVKHICVSKLTIIGSDNGLSPGRRQAIIRTKDAI